LNIRRIPIALRLFLTVLLTTLVITTVSLGVLHLNMQRNFARYVADVEMQKLDYVIENLADVYAVYQDWGNAIQAQILQMEGEAAPDDYDRLSRWWLRRQYDIALQQRYFQEQTLAQVAPSMVDPELPQRQVNEEELRLLASNLPSQFQPFEGLKFPLSSNQNLFRTDRKNGEQPAQQPTGKKQFIQMPDRLGLSSRLSLYDAKRRFVVGEASDEQISYRPIMVNNQIVGYLGLKPVLDQDDALSINFFSNQKRYLFLVYALSILASLIASLLLATYFKKPIQRLLNGTRALTQGNYQYQVKVNRNDELGDLSNELNALAVMLAQVNSLKKLTQDLAALAQVDAQQLQFYFSTVNPWEVVQQELINFQPNFEQAELVVTADGEGTDLNLDLDRFKQIVANLLSNSIRYTEAGGQVHIHTTQDDKEWTLYIDDSPFGLTDEQLARIGERFYRVDDSRTRATGGTGLGLALSCKITQALGGSLSFAHSPLGGLRCKLSFPKQMKP